MANDTLRVDGKDVTLEQIAIDHSDPFYGDDLTITALVAEVRRLRAVEEAALKSAFRDGWINGNLERDYPPEPERREEFIEADWQASSTIALLAAAPETTP